MDWAYLPSNPRQRITSASVRAESDLASLNNRSMTGKACPYAAAEDKKIDLECMTSRTNFCATYMVSLLQSAEMTSPYFPGSQDEIFSAAISRAFSQSTGVLPS